MSREWRPLFSERLAMSHMGPTRRRLHVAFSWFHHWVTTALWSDVQTEPPHVIRAWFWLWRQYRKTWTLR